MGSTSSAGKQRSEADLEARIRSALEHAFPTLPPASFEHQTRFTFNVGGKQITVDGTSASKALARSDILIRHEGTNLAVLELKREGKPLTDDDVAQGMSYAAMLTPHPPLVIVTNGKEHRFKEWYSGKDWEPSPGTGAVKQLFTNASEAAAFDTRRALDVLLGSGSQVWAPAVRAVTDALVHDLYATADDETRPFVTDFLIPRRSTDEVLEHLRSGKRVVLLEGAPLIGKSSVLRELLERTRGGDEFVVLYLEADGSADFSVFGAVADALQDQLTWALDRAAARQWLSRLSHNAGGGRGPALIVVVDGMRPDQEQVRKDVEDLSSTAFGAGVRVVFSMDEAAADRLTMAGRSATKIGRRAARVTVSPLSDAEFGAAVESLLRHRIVIMPGGSRAGELRVPWVLRAILAAYACDPDSVDDDRVPAIPPLVGLELVTIARERFQDHSHLRRHMRDVAGAVLAESSDKGRDPSLVLASSAVYLARDDTLRKFVSEPAVAELQASGILKLAFPVDGEPHFVVRVPELMAAALAGRITAELNARIEEDATAAADWLVDRAANLPLGDVVAARALVDYAVTAEGFPEAVVRRLLERVPTVEALPARGKYVMQTPEGIALKRHVDASGTLIDSRTGGRRVRITRQELEEDGSRLYGNLHPWLILSHLAGVPMAKSPAEGPLPSPAEALAAGERADVDLLWRLIQSEVPLRIAEQRFAPDRVLMHHLPGGVSVVCSTEGIIEPVTLSLFRFLSSTGQDAETWIAEVVKTGSVAACARLDVALGCLQVDADRQKGEWARRMRLDLVHPVLATAGLAH